MIYLFEDRKDRMNLYFKDNIEAYKDVINSSHTIDVKLGELENYFKNLDQLEVLILHKSYVFIDQSITPQNVKEIIRKLGKKFVLFSGGLNTTIVDNDEVVMNSGDFYNNLPKFLKHYQESKDFNLSYLIFSNEREINLHQLKKFQNEVFKAILSFNTHGENAIKLLLKKVKLSSDEYLLSESFNPYKEKLNDLTKKESINAQTLFSQLQKMIASYENN